MKQFYEIIRNNLVDNTIILNNNNTKKMKNKRGIYSIDAYMTYFI